MVSGHDEWSIICAYIVNLSKLDECISPLGSMALSFSFLLDSLNRQVVSLKLDIDIPNLQKIHIMRLSVYVLKTSVFLSIWEYFLLTSFILFFSLILFLTRIKIRLIFTGPCIRRQKLLFQFYLPVQNRLF